MAESDEDGYDKPEVLHEQQAGEFAEGMSWQILGSQEKSCYFYPENLCKHTKILEQDREDRLVHRIQRPRVVYARNEGGYCCTVVCLDCIIEWAML